MTNAESDLGNTGDVAEEDQQSLATQAHRSIAQFASAGDSDPSLPCACFVSRLWRRMADAVGGESTAGRPGPALERGQVALPLHRAGLFLFLIGSETKSRTPENGGC